MKVERRELVGREHDTVRVVHDAVVIRTQRGGGIIPVAAVAEEVPIERDTFKISYECGHCHHQWSEMVPVVKKEGKGAPTTEINPA